MKILFICGTYASGKDGVADYINKMSCALTKKGHEIKVLALRDKYCKELDKEIQISDETPFSITCISKNTKTKKRFTVTQKIVNEFNPEWISLQFVPFGFNKKGIPFWLPNFLNKLEGGFNLEIMFHELWVGRKNSIKNKIVSLFQEAIIKNLLKKNQPKVIHTHLPVYLSSIEKLGFKVYPLPLFSNITPTKAIPINKKENTFKLAFFSQINATPIITNFINILNLELHEKGISSELIIIGGEKGKVLKYKENYKKLCPLLKTITSTGFLDEKEISKIIQHCDLGITPVPFHALGKSGTAAAFLAHGIPIASPVINKEYSEDIIGFFDSSIVKSIITKPNLDNILNAKITAENNKHKFYIEYLSSVFLQDLKNNEN